jgi:hypothetical protein
MKTSPIVPAYEWHHNGTSLTDHPWGLLASLVATILSALVLPHMAKIA